jgi:hypothetical protein
MGKSVEPETLGAIDGNSKRVGRVSLLNGATAYGSAYRLHQIRRDTSCIVNIACPRSSQPPSMFPEEERGAKWVHRGKGGTRASKSSAITPWNLDSRYL